MKSRIIILGIIISFVISTAFLQDTPYTIEQLREIYSGDQAKWPAATLDAAAKPGFKDIGFLGKPVYPKNNPYSAEKAKLGKLLFFDPRMSVSGQIACASCHDPELGWGDGRRVSYGHDRQNGNATP